MKSLGITIILALCVLMVIIYATIGGNRITVAQKEYDILCIEGLTYIAINRNLQSAMMSIMLDKESKVIPCYKSND